MNTQQSKWGFADLFIFGIGLLWIGSGGSVGVGLVIIGALGTIWHVIIPRVR